MWTASACHQQCCASASDPSSQPQCYAMAGISCLEAPEATRLAARQGVVADMLDSQAAAAATDAQLAATVQAALAKVNLLCVCFHGGKD